mgnify:CR=1 FL=1|tara:strand:- start:2475 stop:2912 length:438 start_codon:yes stop_codon:yes gene_type:complete
MTKIKTIALTLLIIAVIVFVLFEQGIITNITGKVTENLEMKKTIDFLEENNITLYIKDTCKPCVKQKEEFGARIPKMIERGIVVDCTKLTEAKCYGIMPKWTHDGDQIAGGYMATEHLVEIFTRLIKNKNAKLEQNQTAEQPKLL